MWHVVRGVGAETGRGRTSDTSNPDFGVEEAAVALAAAKESRFCPWAR